jgi:hypothetical protein
MKTLILASAVTLAAAGASAHDVYGGLAEGNPDLFDQHPEVLGVQPGVGTVTDIYNGLADGNRDLFQRRESTGSAGPRPDVYQSQRGNQDLSY